MARVRTGLEGMPCKVHYVDGNGKHANLDGQLTAVDSDVEDGYVMLSNGTTFPWHRVVYVEPKNEA